MREHEYTVDLPHAAPRLWALFQRYDLWKEFAPAVLDVDVVYPGDAGGNGLLRRVEYPLRARGLGHARADGPEPHAAALPRALPHEDADPAVVRGIDLPVHQQEE